MLIVTLGLLPALVATQGMPVVERGRVGTVAIGAAAETIAFEFKDRARLIDLKLEGTLSPALEIRLFGSDVAAGLVAEISPSNNKLVVTRINVVDPRLRTKEGIGIGSTYAELRSHYSVDWVGSGEGRFFARVESLGMSFSLDPSGGLAAQVGRNIGRVPPDIRVVGVLLTR
jgi:hypothetical protein